VADTNGAFRLGTRGSQLALWQAKAVAARLQETSGCSCRIVVIKTSGDRLQEAPLSEVGGKRLFVKEIEDALLADEIDMAVHSSKDMPAVLPDGLTIGNFVGGLVFQQILGLPGVAFDGPKFEYLGVPAQDNFIIGIAKSTGITSVEQWKASGTIL